MLRLLALPRILLILEWMLLGIAAFLAIIAGVINRPLAKLVLEGGCAMEASQNQVVLSS
jgi:hypothetical protein